MKRLALLAALFVIIATAAPVKAEAPCPLCFVASWVDTPNGAELPIDNAYLAGWAFKCSSGETPISIAASSSAGIWTGMSWIRRSSFQSRETRSRACQTRKTS